MSALQTSAWLESESGMDVAQVWLGYATTTPVLGLIMHSGSWEFGKFPFGNVLLPS